MKWTGMLVLIGTLHVAAAGMAQTVTYTGRNVPLVTVLKAIRQQTGYTVFYDKADLEGSRPVTVQLQQTPLKEALEAVLAGQPLTFEIQGTMIDLIRRKEPAVPVTPPTTAPPPGDVHGRITDSAGNPLEGVNIAVKGTKKGTITSANGDFTLKGIDPDAVLIISSVGYETQTIALKGRTALVLPLRAVSTALGEVQVINKGYYNTTQALNTGSVTVVKGEVIQNQPVSDPIMALEARVPGLYISQASGVPGANEVIMLRGKNSILNGNDPLYIVDGVPFTSTTLTSPYALGSAVGYGPQAYTPQYTSQTGSGMSPFNSLNPADIESIEVLKDADATAIYGSRGANGVILITTKKGKAGQTKVDLNVYSGAGKVASKLHLLNTQQYLSMRHQAFQNDGVAVPSITTTPLDRNYDINGTWDTTRYTDWQKVLIGGTAQFTNAQASISGGNSNTQFLIGGGYSRQTTVYPGDYSDQKASVNVNINHASSNQKFHSQLNAQYVSDNDVLPWYDFAKSVNLEPDAPAAYNADGSFNFQNNTWTNPLIATATKSGSITNNMTGSLSLGYEILPGLTLKSVFGYTHMEMNQSYFLPGTAYYTPTPAERTAGLATTTVKNWIIEPQISYSGRIGQGKLDALIGTSNQENGLNSFGEIATGFLSDALISNIGNASTITLNGSTNTQYKYEAVYGRIGYNWQDKYVLNLTARRDGSSRFGPGRQFGNFGAVGGAWIFSREKLIADKVSALSFGKLRVSYGTTGNDQIGDYQYLSTYTSYGTAYQSVNGLYPQNLPNAIFGWETVRKLEGGVDLGFLKDRILLNLSYYRNRSGNQLISQPLPSQDGFTSIQSNMPATVQNSGFEGEFSTTNIRSKNFTWTSAFNISVPRNKLVAFANLANTTYAGGYVIGKSLFIPLLYHYIGIDPQKGIYTFLDVNKDGQLNLSDVQYFDNKAITQSYFGGFQNTVSYKEWRLDFLFQFVKQNGRNYVAAFNTAPGFFSDGSSNQLTYVLDNWKAPGDKANIQKFSQGGDNSVSTAFGHIGQSDYAVSDASFIRLKNVSLSYNLPQSLQKRWHLQNARVYMLAQNLWTITSYKGFDPETQGLSLPPLRMITGGIQITL